MKNFKFIAACTLLVVAIASMVRWFMITAKDISFEAMKTEYAEIFPSFLQNNRVSTFVVFLILGLATLLFVQSRKSKGIRIPASIGAVLCSILAFWQIFSLM